MDLGKAYGNTGIISVAGVADLRNGGIKKKNARSRACVRIGREEGEFSKY